ncbi:hypothetical protein [Microvirga massiliensis]|uniref:hypothetical protein n=1 Tax=Microvirga massiliensis TaxID=1033741 RepID=UPI00062B3229|nr:hypothetical protein [Microvirga massiliensis]
MTAFKTISGPVSPAQLAMAGYGAPDPRRGNTYALTMATYTISSQYSGMQAVVRENAVPAKGEEQRYARPVYSCSEPVPVDTFAFDMIRRASASADGNGFFGFYNARSAKHHDGTAHQYSSEAAHAILALEGLNIVPEDLVAVALLGQRAQECLKPARDPARLKATGTEALARLIARVVLNSGETDAAVLGALDQILSQTRRLVEETLSSSDPKTTQLS